MNVPAFIYGNLLINFKEFSKLLQVVKAARGISRVRFAVLERATERFVPVEGRKRFNHLLCLWEFWQKSPTTEGKLLYWRK